MVSPYVSDNTSNPYADRHSGPRRYEIVAGDNGFFRYTVYKYYGDDTYPFGSVTGVASTMWGAKRTAKKDAKKEEKRIVKTLFI